MKVLGDQDPNQRPIHARRFRTRPSAQAKLIIFCPIFSDSMRSAITRSASASTAASASLLCNAVGHNAGQLWNLGDPPPVILAPEFNLEIQPIFPPPRML